MRRRDKKEKGKKDSKTRAITAESSGTQPRSAPSKGAEGKAKAKAKPREKEKYGK